MDVYFLFGLQLLTIKTLRNILTNSLCIINIHLGSNGDILFYFLCNEIIVMMYYRQLYIHTVQLCVSRAACVLTFSKYRYCHYLQYGSLTIILLCNGISDIIRIPMSFQYVNPTIIVFLWAPRERWTVAGTSGQERGSNELDFKSKVGRDKELQCFIRINQDSPMKQRQSW